MVTPAVIPAPQPVEQQPEQQQLAPQPDLVPEQPTEGSDHQTYPIQDSTQQRAPQHVQEHAPKQGANQHTQASDEQPALEPAQQQTSSAGSRGRPHGRLNQKTLLNQQRLRNLRGGRNQEGEREDSGS